MVEDRWRVTIRSALNDIDLYDDEHEAKHAAYALLGRIEFLNGYTEKDIPWELVAYLKKESRRYYRGRNSVT